MVPTHMRFLKNNEFYKKYGKKGAVLQLFSPKMR